MMFVIMDFSLINILVVLFQIVEMRRAFLMQQLSFIDSILFICILYKCLQSLDMIADFTNLLKSAY